jgi:hypothetical protein
MLAEKEGEKNKDRKTSSDLQTQRTVANGSESEKLKVNKAE